MHTLESLIEGMNEERPEILKYVEKANTVLAETNKAIGDSEYSRAKKLLSHSIQYFDNLVARNAGIAMTVAGGIGTLDLIYQAITGNFVDVNSIRAPFDAIALVVFDPLGPLVYWIGSSESKKAKGAFISELGEENLTKEFTNKLESELKKYEELYKIGPLKPSP